MSPAEYFVLVTSSMGMWLGITTQIDYDAWKEKGHALALFDVRGLALQPMQGNPGRVAVNIGPPYPSDTQQLKITLFPVSVEIIGEVHHENNTTICRENATLYSRYQEALNQWRAARANIHTATSADLANLKNVTKFPGK